MNHPMLSPACFARYDAPRSNAFCGLALACARFFSSASAQWKDADREIPLLQQAHSEYDKLK